MSKYPEEFSNLAEDVIYNMVLTNVVAVTMMTRLVVNDMKQRKKGIIVNISAGMALQPSPLAAIYAATKVKKILCIIPIIKIQRKKSFVFSHFSQQKYPFRLFIVVYVIFLLGLYQKFHNGSSI